MPHILPHRSREATLFARTLRHSGNPAEKLLWSKLKNKQCCGLRFRKQVPFDHYILDFVCVSKKFVIEIDGDTHYEEGKHEYDASRDAYLKQHGFTVLRVGHRETLTNIEGVMERIQQAPGIECTS